MTSTNLRSLGVRAGSIHVTRVSPLHSSISEKPWIHFALYHFYDHSRLISLIITKYIKKNVSFLLMRELDIAKLYFSTIILIYQPDGSETSQM